jgi:hypothetical protein
MWKKIAAIALGATGLVIGATVFLGPFYRGLTSLFAGNFAQAAVDIPFDLGLPGRSLATPDFGKLLGLGLAAGAGIGIVMLFRYFGRKV